MYGSDTRRWQAVQTRDARAASAFVYAVITTKIYCRPTCPARLARRANVKFFDRASEAQAEGFRSCKRCKPDQDGVLPPAEALISRACEQIEAMGGEVTLNQLAKALHISPRYLHGAFTKIKGCTPATYALQIKQQANTDSSEASITTGPGTPYQLDDSLPVLADVLFEDELMFSDEMNIKDLDFYCSPTSYEQIESLFVNIPNNSLT